MRGSAVARVPEFQSQSRGGLRHGRVDDSMSDVARRRGGQFAARHGDLVVDRCRIPRTHLLP